MSDTAALMKEKNELIQKMLEMQRQFVDFEHKNGISGKDYYYSQEGLLKDYREEYRNMAMRVVDIAHQIVGSVRCAPTASVNEGPPRAGLRFFGLAEPAKVFSPGDDKGLED